MSLLNSLSGQRVLVTGASGFIGTYLCPILASAGAIVHGNSLRETSIFPDGVSHQHRRDLRIPDACLQLLSDSQPDTIIHLSSVVIGARDPKLILPMLQTNVCSSVNLMEAARQCRVKRMISAGSLEEPIAEELPSSPYAASKAATRLYVELYRSMSDIEIAHVRIGMTYGPRTRDHSKLVTYVSLELLNDRMPRLTSGTRQADWIYVRDVAEGMAVIAASDKLPMHELTLGTGKLSSVREVVEALVDLSGTDIAVGFGDIPERQNETSSFGDEPQMLASFAWSPRYTLRQGLRETLDWYRENLDNP